MGKELTPIGGKAEFPGLYCYRRLGIIKKVLPRWRILLVTTLRIRLSMLDMFTFDQPRSRMGERGKQPRKAARVRVTKLGDSRAKRQ